MTAQRSIGWSYCGDGSRTDGPVAFTHGEGHANVERHRALQRYLHFGLRSGLSRYVIGDGDHSGDACGQEEELRSVTALKRSTPAAFFFAQDVHVGVKFTLVRLPGPNTTRPSRTLRVSQVTGQA